MSLDLSTIEHAAQGPDEDRPRGRRAGWCLAAVGVALVLAGAAAVMMLVLPSELGHAGSLTGPPGHGAAVIRTGASTTPPARRAATPDPAPDAQNPTAASTMPPPGFVPPGGPAHRGPIPAFPTSAPGVSIKPSSPATASPTAPATSPAPSATPGS